MTFACAWTVAESVEQKPKAVVLSTELDRPWLSASWSDA